MKAQKAHSNWKSSDGCLSLYITEAFVLYLPSRKLLAGATTKKQVTVNSHLYPCWRLLLAMPKFAKNIRVVRDIKARQGVKDNEIVRRAYLYVARNTSLPPQVRYQAQLQLNTFDKYTRPTTVKNRCYESGRGRGVISEFALCRVSAATSHCGEVLTFCFNNIAPIPLKGLARAFAWCSKGIMVMTLSLSLLVRNTVLREGTRLTYF